MRIEPTPYNQQPDQRINRIESISDGVFAIAMALLVLNITFSPDKMIKSEAHLFASFSSLLPQFVPYFMSFITLGILWTAHSTQFMYIAKSDRHLNRISIFFLMIIVILPFTTAFLNAYIHFKFAVVVYWFNTFLAGMALLIHWQYACNHNYLLVAEDEKNTVQKCIRNRIITVQGVYAVGALLCFIHIYIGFAALIGVQLYYAVAWFPRLVKNK